MGSLSKSFAEGTAADVAAPAAVAAPGCDETSLTPCVSLTDDGHYHNHIPLYLKPRYSRLRANISYQFVKVYRFRW